MTPIDVPTEYAKVLAKYLRTFKLESIDIAFLISTKKEVIDGLLSGKKGIVLKTLELISQAFGLRYFEFGNPNYPVPTYDSLPEKTKARIAYRKKQGPHEETSYDQRDLNEKITVILSNFKKDDEFLAEHIVEQLFSTFQEKVSTSEVSARLTNALTEYVIQTDKKDNSKQGKGRKPYYFQLIKKIPAAVLKEARGKAGERM